MSKRLDDELAAIQRDLRTQTEALMRAQNDHDLKLVAGGWLKTKLSQEVARKELERRGVAI